MDRAAEDLQAEVVAFLKAPATHGGTGPVEVMTTHISMVFLAGERAFKLKRAVKLPYADFSTPALRIAACEKEVALNRLTAPGLYRGTRRITRQSGGGLAFDGPGEPVDAVVEMVRFDQAALFDRMAVEGRLSAPLMDRLARLIARFHQGLPPAPAAGGADTMASVLAINEAAFARTDLFGAGEVAALGERFRAALARQAGALDRRAAAGKVRRCHGDLHLRNICLFEGEPTLFDCIEFDEALATIDVLYDLAFLLMDLWHRDLAAFASLVANRYCDAAGEDEGFALLAFFMAVRAAVRAHVTATQMAAAGERAGALAGEARAYFDLAARLLAPPPPRLVAVGGLSGSGKSTVAEALAPHAGAPPGARILESDRLRKALFGVPAETRLGPEAYRPEVSDRVYAELAGRAEKILAGGGTVVVNAVFDRQEHRAAVEAAARRRNLRFDGFWLDLDAETLLSRVRARAGGPSDATAEVLKGQLARDPGAIGWSRLAAGAPVEALVGRIRQALDTA